MSQKGRWLVLAVIVATCFLITNAAWAQQPADTFWVNYFANNTLSRGLDQEVRIINTGAYAPSFPPAPLCAMVYVFNNDQEMKECCGCLISTNGLAELSVYNDLTNNVFADGRPANGDIKVVSATVNAELTVAGLPVEPYCDPTGGGVNSKGQYTLNIAPTPDLRAWGTHLPGGGRTTEAEFEEATLSTAELDSLQEECTGILAVGSGYGYCGLRSSNSSFFCGPNPF
jgi:hypothetical protein